MLKICLLNIFLASAAGLFQQAYAQAYDFRSITVNEGLPHGQVRDIHQAEDGYIWIATAASGLVKYDGHNYELYSRSDGLKDDSIHYIFENSDNRLWAATYEGGASYKSGNSFVNPFSGLALDSLYVTSIDESPEGDMWFSTIDGGIFIYDGTQIENLTEDDGLVGNGVWDVHWSSDGTVWIATTEGLSVLKDGTFANYTHKDGISGEYVFAIAEYSGTIWLATSNGVTTYDGTTFTAITEIDGRQLHYVYDIIADSDGKIWVGMENDGIFWIHDGTYTHINRTKGLVSNRIYRLYEDQNGDVWVGTDERGINIFKGQQFTFFNTGNGLASNEVYSLFRDNEERIWVGTEEGLQSYQNNRFESHKLPSEYSAESQIWLIELLSEGSLLLQMNDNTLLDYNDGTWSNFSKKIGLTYEWIYDLNLDSTGALWISSDSGLLYFADDSLRNFTTTDGLPSNYIYQTIESKNGEIWIATYGGVAVYDGQEFRSYTTADGLAHYNVNVVTQDSYGDMWIGTSAGVSHFSIGTDSTSIEITNFGKSHGMKLVETLSLWFDEDDQLWQGTNGGIHQLDVANYRETGKMDITHHSLADHGIGVETMHKAVVTDSLGRAWFGTMNGIAIVGDQPEKPRQPPVTHINDIRLDGSKIDPVEASDSAERQVGTNQTPAMNVPHDNKTLSFSFSGLDFLNPTNVQYRYMLDGFDKEWSQPSVQNSATYTNLAPGDYDFMVQSRSESSDWSDHAATFNFTVDAPFWMTPWFWLLGLSIVGFAFYGITAVKLNRLEREKLSQLVDEKTHHLQEALDEKVVLLKEIHHRVKNNLAVIYSLLDLQSGYLEDEKTKVIFDDSKMRVRSIALVHEKLYQNDNLSKIEANNYIPDLVGVITDAHQTRDKSIHLNLDIENMELSVDQGIPCGLILNELISNTYKHAFTEQTCGDVNVQLKEIDGFIELKISDNGKGLPEDFAIGNTNSLGLILVKTLCDQIKADLDITSNNPGTVFNVRFKKEGSDPS